MSWTQARIILAGYGRGFGHRDKRCFALASGASSTRWLGSADGHNAISLQLAVFVGKRHVFSWAEDVCVEAKPNLVVVFATIIVVDHPSSSAGSSCAVDEATLPSTLSRSEPAYKAVRALLTPGLDVQSPFRVKRSGYVVAIELAPLWMTGAACQMQSNVTKQRDLPLQPQANVQKTAKILGAQKDRLLRDRVPFALRIRPTPMSGGHRSGSDPLRL